MTHQDYVMVDTQSFIDMTGDQKVVWIQHRRCLQMDAPHPLGSPSARSKVEQSPLIEGKEKPAHCCGTAKLPEGETYPKESHNSSTTSAERDLCGSSSLMVCSELV